MHDMSSNNMTVPSRRGGSSALPGRFPIGPQEKTGSSIRDYLSLFFKYRLAFLVTFLTVIACAVVFALFIYTPKYQARALLLIKFGWENFAQDMSPAPSAETRRVPSVNQTEIIQSEVRILRSREMIEKVVNNIKPENLYPSLLKSPEPGLTNTDAAIFYFERDLGTVASRGNIIEVSLTGANPSVLASAVNQLVTLYIDKRNEIFKDPKSVIFLQQKVDEFSRKFGEAEVKLTAFKNETQVTSFEEQRKFLLAQQAHLVKEMYDSETAQKELTQKVAEYDKQMASIPEKVDDAGHGMAIRTTSTEHKLLNLQLQERELLARYKEDNKLVQGVREQIVITEKYLVSQSKGTPNQMVNQVWQGIQTAQFVAKADLKAQQSRLANLEQQIREFSAKMQAFEDLEARNNELTREVSMNDERLRGYKQRLEEAKIQDELERQKMTSVSVVERASPSGVTTNPLRLPLLIPIVIAVALAGGLGCSYLLGMLSHGVSTPTQAEKRLDMPVLVTISAK